jgi:hypothetical protein
MMLFTLAAFLVLLIFNVQAGVIRRRPHSNLQDSESQTSNEVNGRSQRNLGGPYASKRKLHHAPTTAFLAFAYREC